MSFENKYIFFLCALGVFNCLLVSFYFLFFDRRRRIQNTLFGILTALLSIKLGKTLYMSFSLEKDLIFCQMGLSASFLIGVVLYYYLKMSLDRSENLPKTFKWHFSILFLVIVAVGLFRPYSNNVGFWNDYFVWVIYTVWGGHLVLCGFLLKKTFGNLFLCLDKNKTIEVWLVSVFIGNVLIYLAYIVGYFWLYLVEMLTFSFVFYAMLAIYLLLKNRNVIFKDIPEKYGSNKIAPHEAQALKQSLSALMDKEELFKNPNLKLQDVASKMNVSQHKLSQFLNDNLGKSFSSYINQKRIGKAIQLLKENNLFTLEAIGYECGFSTKSVFYSTFKKMTGQTPSSFRNKTS